MASSASRARLGPALLACLALAAAAQSLAPSPETKGAYAFGSPAAEAAEAARAEIEAAIASSEAMHSDAGRDAAAEQTYGTADADAYGSSPQGEEAPAGEGDPSPSPSPSPTASSPFPSLSASSGASSTSTTLAGPGAATQRDLSRGACRTGAPAFAAVDATAASVQAALASGAATCRDVVVAHLQRLAAFDAPPASLALGVSVRGLGSLGPGWEASASGGAAEASAAGLARAALRTAGWVDVVLEKAREIDASATDAAEYSAPASPSTPADQLYSAPPSGAVGGSASGSSSVTAALLSSFPLLCSPLVVKDNVDQAGFPTSAGVLGLDGNVAVQDAPALRSLRLSGAVVVARGNMAELAVGPTLSTSSRGGTTRNPYDLWRSPGGSSSGPAAAVAASLAVLGLGTDTGSSVRGPAAWCGVVGYRPSAGLLSRTGILPLHVDRDTPGIVGKSTDDVLRALRGMLANGGWASGAGGDGAEAEVEATTADNGTVVVGRVATSAAAGGEAGATTASESEGQPAGETSVVDADLDALRAALRAALVGECLNASSLSYLGSVLASPEGEEARQDLAQLVPDGDGSGVSTPPLAESASGATSGGARCDLHPAAIAYVSPLALDDGSVGWVPDYSADDPLLSLDLADAEESSDSPAAPSISPDAASPSLNLTAALASTALRSAFLAERSDLMAALASPDASDATSTSLEGLRIVVLAGIEDLGDDDETEEEDDGGAASPATGGSSPAAQGSSSSASPSTASASSTVSVSSLTATESADRAAMRALFDAAVSRLESLGAEVVRDVPFDAFNPLGAAWSPSRGGQGPATGHWNVDGGWVDLWDCPGDLVAGVDAALQDARNATALWERATEAEAEEAEEEGGSTDAGMPSSAPTASPSPSSSSPPSSFAPATVMELYQSGLYGPAVQTTVYASLVTNVSEGVAWEDETWPLWTAIAAAAVADSGAAGTSPGAGRSIFITFLASNGTRGNGTGSAAEDSSAAPPGAESPGGAAPSPAASPWLPSPWFLAARARAPSSLAGSRTIGACRCGDPSLDPCRRAMRTAYVNTLDAHNASLFLYPTWNALPTYLGAAKDSSGYGGNNSPMLEPLVGAPGVTVPIGLVGALPVGATFAARPLEDDLALEVAMAFERGGEALRKRPGLFRECIDPIDQRDVAMS